MRIRIAAEAFDPQAEIAAFAAGRDDAGALVNFVGTCRAKTGDVAVEELRIDHYPGFTEKEIARLAAETAQHCDCPDLLVVHRVGVIRPGEAIVLVAARSIHRANAFKAVESLMDYLKTDAPLWKKESGPGGARWIEPRPQDQERRAKAEEGRKMSETLTVPGGAPGGGRLDPDKAFRPLRVAVLTVSDTRDAENDTSGKLLSDRVTRDGHVLAARGMVKDSIAEIQAQVKKWIADPGVDVVISTGGTGLTGRDVTPEALRPLFDKTIEGFETVWHMTSFQTVGLSTMQSRACAGLAKGTLIFALPGSNGACKDGWDRLIRWQLDSRHRPCNLAELISRFTEA